MKRGSHFHDRDSSGRSGALEGSRGRRLLALVALSAAAAFGCDAADGSPSNGAMERTPPSASAIPPGDSSAATAAPSPSGRQETSARRSPKALTDPSIRWTLDLPPPPTPPQGLAFGKARLGRIRDGALLVYDPRSLRARELPVQGARAVIPLAGGSLLVHGALGLYRLDFGQEQFVAFPPITVLGETVLWPDRSRLDRLWVRHGSDATLYGYDLDREVKSRLLVPREIVPLEGARDGRFTSLRDGSFLYATDSAFRRFVAGARPRDVEVDPSGVWKILPSERLDRVWVIRETGEVELAELTGRRIRRVALMKVEPAGDGALTPYGAAAEGKRLAVLFLIQPPGRPKTFRLDVLDTGGARLFSAGFPPELTEDEAWVSVLSENANVALGGDPPQVAAGGPAVLRVWDLATGERKLEER